MITHNAKKEELKLNTPFRAEEIEWRASSSGFDTAKKQPWATIVPYLKTRAIQERLDTIMGPDKWMCSFAKVDGGFICTLSIKFSNDWIMKQDGADPTEVEPFKGGISDSFKRAARMWGIGRELTNTGRVYAQFVDKSSSDYSLKINGTTYYWRAPL